MIRNIVFDLGNVLVNVHFDKFKQGLLWEGITEDEFIKFYTIKKRAMGYEKGKIDTKNFLRLCQKKLNYKITQKSFRKYYTEIFSEIPQMKKLLAKISKNGDFRLYLLSNTNAVHFNYIKREFPYIHLLHKFGLSFKLGYLKPDVRIYRKFTEKYGIKPHDTLFIDDLEANCASARDFGFNVILFKGYDDFIEKFNNKLIADVMKC